MAKQEVAPERRRRRSKSESIAPNEVVPELPVTPIVESVVTKGRQVEFDADYVRDVSVLVYKDRLGERDAADMLSEHGPDKFRRNAASLDALTRSYLKALKPIV